MPPTADRNLLLGILALQTDFITRDALIAATNAWALERHRPLRTSSSIGARSRHPPATPSG
jgi:hypothetical protein